jgi:hypothetical protein
MNSKLYFLHIPKTGGQTLIQTLFPILDRNNIKYYKNTIPPHTEDLNNNVFLSGHFGTYPLEHLSGFDVACIFRDPVERSLSNFNYIYPIIKDREEYKAIPEYPDKLRYYLFEDENFLFHRNTQSRFICNSADQFLFVNYDWGMETNRDSKVKKIMTNGWLVDNSKTSFELAKKQIDSFKIVGTVEKHAKFMADVWSWFKNNYGIDMPKLEEKILNNSQTEHNGLIYHTEDLKKMLTKVEYNRVVENNSLDCEVYEYVRKR